MENTPLELYETAYKLHYSEHRISDAIIYYQRLIKEFPESNECGYAVIQLQKIKASEISAEFQHAATLRNNNQTAPTIFLIVTCLLIIAVTYLTIHFNKRLVIEQQRTSLAFNALSKFLRGNDEDALLLLNHLKEFKKEDIMPYELCADIYRKENDFDLARNEYAMFFQVNPTLRPTKNEKGYMYLSDSTQEKNSMQPQQTTNPPSPSPRSVPVKKKSDSGNKKKSVTQQLPPVKSDNGLYLVNPDSLSYF